MSLRERVPRAGSAGERSTDDLTAFQNGYRVRIREQADIGGRVAIDHQQVGDLPHSNGAQIVAAPDELCTVTRGPFDRRQGWKAHIVHLGVELGPVITVPQSHPTVVVTEEKVDASGLRLRQGVVHELQAPASFQRLLLGLLPQ